jgi:hypothetical protein
MIWIKMDIYQMVNRRLGFSLDIVYVFDLSWNKGGDFLNMACNDEL